MRLMEGVLAKLQTAIENLAIDKDVIWDLTSDHPIDVWINVISKVLIQLVEIRGYSIAGNQSHCAAVDDGPCGVVARARLQGRELSIHLVGESIATGLKEEVRLTTLQPGEGEVDWDEEITFCAFGNPDA